MTTEPLLQIQSISKSFKGVKAVKNLDLAIGRNEYVALLGPNGAGKTTLVEMIEGLQEPDTGRIVIGGQTWRNDAEALRRRMGISLQETKFIDKLKLIETLELFASFYGLGRNRTEEVLRLINLEEKRNSYVVNLSGGQRQRLALGVAILNQPEILLLDEPTTGLDPNARREIWDILMDLKTSHQTTMILTTHYMEEAAYLCDRIVIMDQGQVLADGTLNQLLNTYATGELITFQVSKPVEEAVLRRVEGLMAVRWLRANGTSADTTAELQVESITSAMPQLLHLFREQQAEILEFECRKKTLDDLFVAMTGRKLNE